MANYKDLYELEKRQRLNVETTMKEIVNGLCLSAYTIAEDSKMQLLKNDLQRIQQEIARLETSKQERLQQHLMSVGGMIQQMTGATNSIMNQQRVGNLQMLTATTPQQGRITQNANKTNGQTPQNGGSAFPKPRSQPRQPRRKRNVEDIVRPNSAVPPAVKKDPVKRPSSALPKDVASSHNVEPANVCVVKELEPTSQVEEPLKCSSVMPSLTVSFTPPPLIISSENKSTAKKLESTTETNNTSQTDEDIVMTEEHTNNNGAEKKNQYFCEYCETAAIDEPSTIVHVWSHVNEIRRMHAFECVVPGCMFKTNVTKDALAHKKSAHTAEEECKILDRRDTLAEYFKHCINKYFIHLDDVTKDKVFEARHS